MVDRPGKNWDDAHFQNLLKDIKVKRFLSTLVKNEKLTTKKRRLKNRLRKRSRSWDYAVRLKDIRLQFVN